MTCSMMVDTATATSAANNTQLPAVGSIDCDTSNAVYLLQCTDCGKQYTGETSQEIRTRMSGHASDIRTEKDKPVARHVTSHHNNQNPRAAISVTGLRALPPGTSKLRRVQVEQAYAHILGPFSPAGMNTRH